MKKLIYSMLTLAMVALVSCKDSDSDNTEENETEESISDETLEANYFVYSIMSSYYYWNKEMFNDTVKYSDPKIDYRTQTDTEEYFYNILSDKDRFSFISDDANETENELSGISTTMGWDIILTYIDDDKHIGAIINLVYPDSPAKEGGIRRGDVVYKVDGEYMTESNYSSLINKTSATYSVLRYDASAGEYTKIDDVALTAIELTENPVYNYTTFEKDGNNIGYLMYTSYIEDFDEDLDVAFQYFKENNVNKLILDLRYNTGGAMTAFQHLCSLIAPEADVTSGKEILYYKYNEIMSSIEAYSRKNNNVTFDKTVSNNLNLSDIVIITGRSTYSASEATIMALKPYMNVTLIGNTTGGKNSTMFVMTPDLFTETNARGVSTRVFSKSIDNWLIAPIVAEYYNANDQTFDPTEGISPDYVINEYQNSDMGEIGSDDEPLTAAAIEYITTGNVTTKKDAKLQEVEILEHKGLGIKGAIMNR
ncbi:MAG: hypothetical protein K6G73_13180 [Marinilabiliaceae bacterium]|nr:hypothetical protein [Marinilabiliaceae bacterium]